jgi:hypothetical protein
MNTVLVLCGLFFAGCFLIFFIGIIKASKDAAADAALLKENPGAWEAKKRIEIEKARPTPRTPSKATEIGLAIAKRLLQK